MSDQYGPPSGWQPQGGQPRWQQGDQPQGGQAQGGQAQGGQPQGGQAQGGQPQWQPGNQGGNPGWQGGPPSQQPTWQGESGGQSWQGGQPSPGGQPWQGQQGGQPAQSGQPWSGQQGGQPGQGGQPWSSAQGGQSWQGGQPQGAPGQWGQPTDQPAGGSTPMYPQGQQSGWQPSGGDSNGQQPWAPAGAPKKSRMPLIITVCAVVVALLAATGVWFFAFRDTTKTAGGQSTPQEAATTMLAALTQKDPVGVADQLDPAEAALFSDLSGDILSELRRLNVVTADANANNLSGTTITATGLTFDPAAESINDHLSIVKLTGGTITVTSDPTKIPLSSTIRSTFGDELDAVKQQTKTINIADEVKKEGHPFRIATVQRSGKWYPSLFYTLADNWAQSAGVPNPSASDAIPSSDKGSSPEAAMNAVLEAASAGNALDAISLLDPEEMGVLHDYGKAILTKAGYKGAKATGVTFSNESWNVSDVSGGKLVSVKSLTATIEDKTYSLVRDGDTLTVTAPGEQPVVLNDSTIQSFVEKAGAKLDAQAIDIIKREFKQVIGLGIVMTQNSNGHWYVSPLRSYVGIFTSLLKGLQPADINYFISLAKK